MLPRQKSWREISPFGLLGFRKCAALAVLRTRSPVGEEGEDVGCGDGAVAVEVRRAIGIGVLSGEHCNEIKGTDTGKALPYAQIARRRSRGKVI